MLIMCINIFILFIRINIMTILYDINIIATITILIVVNIILNINNIIKEFREIYNQYYDRNKHTNQP